MGFNEMGFCSSIGEWFEANCNQRKVNQWTTMQADSWFADWVGDPRSSFLISVIIRPAVCAQRVLDTGVIGSYAYRFRVEGRSLSYG
ncbi:MAG: hypothetical protein ACRD8U_15945 [Pyrinomonadaceae bacterium]